MNETPRPPTEPPPNRYASAPPSGLGGDIVPALVSAGLFLFVGFYLAPYAESPSAVYNGSVAAFTWGARIIGIAILAGIGMMLLRVPGVLLLDLIIDVAATGICVIPGLIWLACKDMNGVLVLLFGLVNGNAARAAWTRWRGARSLANHGPYPE